ncbi:hypothetical protein [Sanguibacter gelidistatuariae]|nr:hypothetical protein [Sanguibacter gelidistatuariae]
MRTSGLGCHAPVLPHTGSSHPEAPTLSNTGAKAIPVLVATSLVLGGAGTVALLRRRAHLRRPSRQQLPA